MHANPPLIIEIRGAASIGSSPEIATEKTRSVGNSHVSREHSPSQRNFRKVDPSELAGRTQWRKLRYDRHEISISAVRPLNRAFSRAAIAAASGNRRHASISRSSPDLATGVPLLADGPRVRKSARSLLLPINRPISLKAKYGTRANEMMSPADNIPVGLPPPTAGILSSAVFPCHSPTSTSSM